MTAKVLLVSSVGWPSVARLAAGFAWASCAVEALAPAGAVVLSSRYLSRWHSYRALFPLASLRAAIEAAEPDLLVCCDDRSLSHVLELYRRSAGKRELALLVERSLGNPRAIPRLISRSNFLAEARAEGIRVPDTMAIGSDEDLDDALALLGFPAVLKSDGSWGGEGVLFAHNATEAKAAFAKLARSPSRPRSVARALRRRDAHHLGDAIFPAPRNISAQRFVSGSPAASAFASWQGEIAGAIYYDVIVAEGAIGPPNVIRRVDCPEIHEATLKIAKRFGLSGIHGMDFIRDAQGAVHLIEINPRATQGSTLAFGRGRDLPAALAERLTPAAGIRPAITADTVVFFPREWQRDPASHFLTSAHHDVPWDDPAVLLAILRSAARTAHRSARNLTKEASKTMTSTVCLKRSDTTGGAQRTIR